MPTPIRSRRQPIHGRRAVGAALLIACSGALAACGTAQPSSEVAPDGLIALVGTAGKTTIKRWDATGGDPIAVTAPKGGATWISTGRSDVLAATLADGTSATSDPIRPGTTLAWRIVKPLGGTGVAVKGPDYFATWDPDGGLYAVLAGDLPSGGAIRVVLIDPTVGTAFEIPIDRSVVAAPPAWIDADRLAVVTGDAAAPVTTIVDTRTGATSDGPSGARLLATSGNGRRVATMDGQGAPVVIRDTAAWLGGDGSSVGSVAPPDGSTTAIAFALDATGQRLVVAWQAHDGTVTLAVHDGRSDWRRVAKPVIGAADGAVVAWQR